MRHLQRHIHLCQPISFLQPLRHSELPAGEHWPHKEDSTELWGTLVILPWNSESESGQQTVVNYKGQGLAFGAMSHTQGWPKRTDHKEDLKEPRTLLSFLHQELVTWSRLRQTVYFIHLPPFFPILAANIKNSNLPKLASSEIQASVTEISLKTQQGSVRVWPCVKERTGYQWPKSQTWQLSRSAEPWPSTYTCTDPNF